MKCCALETVGNLAFPPDNRSKFLAAPAFHDLLCRMAGRGMGLVQQCVCTAAIRALAILGELAGTEGMRMHCWKALLEGSAGRQCWKGTPGRQYHASAGLREGLGEGEGGI